MGRQRSPEYQSGKFTKPYIRAANIQDFGVEVSDVLKMDFDASDYSNFELKAGDVLVVEGGSVGRSAIYRGNIPGACFQNTVIRFQANEGLTTPEFANYLFRWYYIREAFRDVARQTTIAHLGLTRFAGMPFLLPPLPEQRRIVEAIEANFARLEAATGALKSANRALARYPTAILHQVMEFGQPGHRGGEIPNQNGWRSEWPTRALGELLCEPLRNGATTRPASEDTGVRTLTLTAVTTGDFSTKNTKPSGISQHGAEAFWLKAGDILIERANTRELVGISAIYRGPERFAVYPDMVIRARFRDDVVPEFASYVLASPLARKYFQTMAKGVAGNMPKIDQPTIRSLKVPHPSQSAQREAIGTIDRHLSMVKATQREVDTATAKLNSLRAAILRAAFEGRLVPQDPTDEPASALLERITREHPTSSSARSVRAREP